MTVQFDPETGYLPPGVHRWAWDEFLSIFAWNSRRAFLAGGLYRALINLKMAGCREVIVDGSYVTSKEIPGDYDIAFDPIGVNGALIDPILIRHSDDRKAMKAKYFGDIFPWGHLACQVTGLIYRDFFQRDRDGEAKGVVLLDLGAMS